MLSKQSALILYCSILTFSLVSAVKPPGYVEPINVPEKDPPKYSYTYAVTGEDKGIQGHQEIRNGINTTGNYYVQTGDAHSDVSYFSDDWGFHPVVRYETKGDKSHASGHFALGKEAVDALHDNKDGRFPLPAEGSKSAPNPSSPRPLISHPTSPNSFVSPHLKPFSLLSPHPKPLSSSAPHRSSPGPFPSHLSSPHPISSFPSTSRPLLPTKGPTYQISYQKPQPLPQKPLEQIVFIPQSEPSHQVVLQYSTPNQPKPSELNQPNYQPQTKPGTVVHLPQPKIQFVTTEKPQASELNRPHNAPYRPLTSPGQNLYYDIVPQQHFIQPLQPIELVPLSQPNGHNSPSSKQDPSNLQPLEPKQPLKSVPQHGPQQPLTHKPNPLLFKQDLNKYPYEKPLSYVSVNIHHGTKPHPAEKNKPNQPHDILNFISSTPKYVTSEDVYNINAALHVTTKPIFNPAIQNKKPYSGNNNRPQDANQNQPEVPKDKLLNTIAFQHPIVVGEIDYKPESFISSTTVSREYLPPISSITAKPNLDLIKIDHNQGQFLKETTASLDVSHQSIENEQNVLGSTAKPQQETPSRHFLRKNKRPETLVITQRPVPNKFLAPVQAGLKLANDDCNDEEEHQHHQQITKTIVEVQKTVNVQVQEKPAYGVRYTPRKPKPCEESGNGCGKTHVILQPIQQIVEKKVPIHVETQKIVEKPVPYPVNTYIDKPVPYPVKQLVDRPVPYEVIKEKIKEVPVYVPRPYPVKEIQEVEKIVEKQVPVVKEVFVPKPYEKIVEKQVPVIKEVERIKEVPVIKHVQVPYEVVREKFVDRPVDRPVYVDREVIKEVKVEVPVEVVKPVEVIKEVPVEKIVEVPVEVIKEIEKIVEKHIDRPVYVDREVIKEVKVEVPVEVIKEKQVDRPVYVDRPINVPVYIPQPYPVKEIVHVPVEKIVHQKVHVPVPYEKKIYVPVYHEKPLLLKPVYKAKPKIPIFSDHVKVKHVHLDFPKYSYPKPQVHHHQHQQIHHHEQSQPHQPTQYSYSSHEQSQPHQPTQYSYSSHEQSQPHQPAQFSYSSQHLGAIPVKVESYQLPAEKPKFDGYHYDKPAVQLNVQPVFVAQPNHVYSAPDPIYAEKYEHPKPCDHSGHRDDYIGPTPLTSDYWATGTHNGITVKRHIEHGRSLRVESGGFLPPLEPSTPIDENGLPLKKDDSKSR